MTSQTILTQTMNEVETIATAYVSDPVLGITTMSALTAFLLFSMAYRSPRKLKLGAKSRRRKGQPAPAFSKRKRRPKKSQSLLGILIKAFF